MAIVMAWLCGICALVYCGIAVYLLAEQHTAWYPIYGAAYSLFMAWLLVVSLKRL